MIYPANKEKENDVERKDFCKFAEKQTINNIQ